MCASFATETSCSSTSETRVDNTLLLKNDTGCKSLKQRESRTALWRWRTDSTRDSNDHLASVDDVSIHQRARWQGVTWISWSRLRDIETMSVFQPFIPPCRSFASFSGGNGDVFVVEFPLEAVVVDRTSSLGPLCALSIIVDMPSTAEDEPNRS